MKAHFELKSILQSINGEEHESYKSIEGEYLFNDYTLLIDHIDADTSSVLARVRVKIPQDVAGFPDDTYKNRSREIALRDFITRRFHERSNSSRITIDNPGQEILDRTSAFVNQSFVEIRFCVNLPVSEEEVASKELETIIFDELPLIIKSSSIFDNLDKDSLYTHIETNEDADFLRNELENLRLIAFVAEGSILPRESETSPLPLQSNDVVPFLSPYILKMDVELPNRGQVAGLCIPRGITVITGDHSSGKSTLLDAIEHGIYNHIPGDGREYVVSNPNSVKISAEDGRNVVGVNISGFTKNPEQSLITTNSADPDISQVVNIVEAVEVGADVLLIDQNSSSKHFFIHNKLAEDAESISPYIEKARSLFNEYMVSSILVIEDAEEYFDVANFVIRVTNYKAEDITAEAKTIAENKEREMGIDGYIGSIGERIPLPESIDSKTVDLSSIEQIVSEGQINAIVDATEYSKKYMDSKKSFRQVCSLVMLDMGRGGLDILNSDLHGNYAEFRKIELAAAMNRLKTIKVEQKS